MIRLMLRPQLYDLYLRQPTFLCAPNKSYKELKTIKAGLKNVAHTFIKSNIYIKVNLLIRTLQGFIYMYINIVIFIFLKCVY